MAMGPPGPLVRCPSGSLGRPRPPRIEPRAPRSEPRAPKSDPRPPQDPPGTTQDRPRKAQEPPRAAQERPKSDFTSKNKPGYRGTGSAFRARAASTARKTRAARGASTARKRERQHQEQPGKKGKSSERIQTAIFYYRLGPLLGRCAASPGAWSWERFACCPAVSFRAFRPEHGGERSQEQPKARRA